MKLTFSLKDRDISPLHALLIFGPKLLIKCKNLYGYYDFKDIINPFVWLMMLGDEKNP